MAASREAQTSNPSGASRIVTEQSFFAVPQFLVLTYSPRCRLRCLRCLP
jgi:hypothetical protein